MEHPIVHADKQALGLYVLLVEMCTSLASGTPDRLELPALAADGRPAVCMRRYEFVPTYRFLSLLQ